MHAGNARELDDQRLDRESANRDIVGHHPEVRTREPTCRTAADVGLGPRDANIRVDRSRIADRQYSARTRHDVSATSATSAGPLSRPRRLSGWCGEKTVWPEAAVALARIVVSRLELLRL